MIERYLPVKAQKYMNMYYTGTIVCEKDGLTLCNLFRSAGMIQTDFDKLCVEFVGRLNGEKVKSFEEELSEQKVRAGIELEIDKKNALIQKPKRGRPAKVKE